MAETFVTAVVAQRPVAAGHYELIAAHHPALDAVQPGQFINVRVARPGSWDPLLRRPFSLYRRFANGDWSIVYRVVGRGTEALARLRPGDDIDVLGPLGRGFVKVPEARRLLLVGGGVGVPPLLFLAQTWQGQAEMKALLGFAEAGLAFGWTEFAALGIEAEVATDDGSLGHRGFVTDLLENQLNRNEWDGLYACGPRPMLEAVARIACRAGVPCQLAFEEAMGCGVGACLSCVLPVRTEGGAQYQRVCREGPVFWAEEVYGHG